MSGGFWPTLPLKIPYSEGVPHWWDPAWWIFQIVVMTILLLTLRRVALSVDKSDKAAKTAASGRRPGASSDQPPSIPG